MKKWLIIITQLLFLFAINKFGYLIVDTLHLPLPGNVMGMILLFVLLSTGVIQMKWIEKGSNILIKHLAFFFIPIAVGLMNYGGLFLSNGITLIGAILVSIAIGIYMTGSVSQIIARRKAGVTTHENIDYSV